MAATNDSGLGHGSSGKPQTEAEEQNYPNAAADNESTASTSKPPVYDPSPKHEPGHSWGSENPISSKEEGQQLLETGYPSGKQLFNVTSEGKLVKFQPDNSPNNGYHAYGVSKPRDIPSTVLKQMLSDGKISKAEYNKLRKGKK